MFRFFLRSDEYVYKTFLESYVAGLESGDMSESLAIGNYIVDKRPRLVEKLFNLFYKRRNGKRFSYQSKKGTL